MKDSYVEVGRFNGLKIIARQADTPLSPVATFLQNTTAFKGTGLVVWLTPNDKPGFDEVALNQACALTPSGLIKDLIPIIGPTVRHMILSEFWPQAEQDLIWHLMIRDLESGPVIELVVSTKHTMEMLIAFYHCERSATFV